MKFIFGPVPSRRLGRSLGIDPIPKKTCNYQCIYCQLGRTPNFTNERQNFYPKEEILAELELAIKANEDGFDYITLVGSGEPTLYKDLKGLIQGTKALTDKPICVITNGGLLHDKDVQEALMAADVVLPTLDAGDEKKFILINRPHPSIKYDEMIQGFINFRKQFEGKFWLEIMVMKDINDDRESLMKIKEKLDLIQPDQIDINVPVRPPAEPWVKIPDKSFMPLLKDVFGEYHDISFPEHGSFKISSHDFSRELINIIERHPMRQTQIIETFSSNELDETAILEELIRLEKAALIVKRHHENNIFWRLKEK